MTEYQTAFDKADRSPVPPIVLTGPEPAVAAGPGAAAWRRYGLVWTGVVAGILALLNRDAAHLFRTWWNNETYGHCLLILPIVGWLVWQRRAALRQLSPQPWAPGALLIAGAGLIWLIGQFADVALARHTGLVLMVVFTVPTVLGLAVARGVLFPLFFALFLIPVGDQLEPRLQTLTANMATWGLRAVGVPTHMDGVFISVPNGDFEVAQACSGVRFLIAMVAFGALVANVCFKSWKRRLIFMAFAFALPVAANGVRVWGTIYAAYLTTPEVARGIDHVVYGWVFFAIVMVVLLAVSWKFFDRPVDDPFIEPGDLQRPGTRAGPVQRLALAAGLAVAAAAAAPVWAAVAEGAGAEQTVAAVQLNPPPGWTVAPTAGMPWKPIYKNPDGEHFVTFAGPDGRPVEVYLAVYDRQRQGREVVGFGQGVFEDQEAESWSWAANQPAPPGAAAVQINRGPFVRDIVQYYWVNAVLTGSPYTAKIESLKAKLLGGEPRAATLVVSAQRQDAMTSERPAIDALIAAMGPPDEAIKRAIVAPAS